MRFGVDGGKDIVCQSSDKSRIKMSATAEPFLLLISYDISVQMVLGCQIAGRTQDGRFAMSTSRASPKGHRPVGSYKAE
jgi:hypothetical protein